MVKAKLTAKVGNLLRQAVSTSGSYDVDENVWQIEESLTPKEYTDVTKFFEWLLANGKTFGRNVKDVWAEFAKAVN
jgi:hypothetical protein